MLRMRACDLHEADAIAPRWSRLRPASPCCRATCCACPAAACCSRRDRPGRSAAPRKRLRALAPREVLPLVGVAVPAGAGWQGRSCSRGARLRRERTVIATRRQEVGYPSLRRIAPRHRDLASNDRAVVSLHRRSASDTCDAAGQAQGTSHVAPAPGGFGEVVIGTPVPARRRVTARPHHVPRVRADRAGHDCLTTPSSAGHSIDGCVQMSSRCALPMSRLGPSPSSRACAERARTVAGGSITAANAAQAPLHGTINRGPTASWPPRTREPAAR
jgi:hypothetical protein